MWDAFQIDQWWRTAAICHHLHNLQMIVFNALSKKNRMEPKDITSFHPYIESKTPQSRRMKITHKNFSLLKTIGNALCAKK